MNLRDRAKKLKTDVPAVFIALGKKETPVTAKILAGLTVAYALSPIDLIPDFIPVIGLFDEIILLPALIAVIIRLIPEEVMIECRNEAKDLWQNGKPKHWYYALPIIFVWAIIIILIIKAIFKF